MSDKKPEQASGTAELESLMGDLIGELLSTVIAVATKEEPKTEKPKIHSAPAVSRGRRR